MLSLHDQCDLLEFDVHDQICRLIIASRFVEEEMRRAIRRKTDPGPRNFEAMYEATLYYAPAHEYSVGLGGGAVQTKGGRVSTVVMLFNNCSFEKGF